MSCLFVPFGKRLPSFGGTYLEASLGPRVEARSYKWGHETFKSCLAKHLVLICPEWPELRVLPDRSSRIFNLCVATVYFLDSSDRISRGSNTGERENILFTLFVCCHSKIEMIECLLGWRRPCQCPRPALSGFTKDSLKEHPAWRRLRMTIIHKLLSPDGLSYIYRILCGDLV